MSFRRWWEEHFGWAELLAGAAVTAGFVCWSEAGGYTSIAGAMQGSRASIYTALSGIYAALLGFNVATMAVVVTLCTSTRLTHLRRSKQYGTVWDVFKRGHRALAVGLAVSFLSVLLDRDAAPSRLCLYASAAVMAWSAVRFARCLWVLELCADQVGKPDQPASAGGP